MAVGKVIVSVVDVGQGQCTFVEIWDAGSVPKLTNTLLLDCGSDRHSTAMPANLEYIAETVSSMKKPTFDCVIFSHSDQDHISLMKPLLELFTKAKKPVIKEVWYGGSHDNYTKGKKLFNILDYLQEEDYCEEKRIKSPPSNDTDYSKKNKDFRVYIWQNDDATVKLRTIIANVMNDDVPAKTAKKRVRTPPEELNRVSLVVGVYYANSSFVVCGDATNKTMAAANAVFSSPTTVFDNNKMTTLPHHGSRSTGLAVVGSKVASANAVKVVNTFATLLKSKLITVSANQDHRHPSLELINHFMPTLTNIILRDPRLKEKNSHRVTANVDIDLKTPKAVTILKHNDYSFETIINTYSTRYYDGADTFSYQLGKTTVKESSGVVDTAVPINEFASWKFSTDSAGATSVNGFADLKQIKFTGAPLASYLPDQKETIDEIFNKTRFRKPMAKQPARASSSLNNRLQQFH